MATIITKNSSTASSVPTNAQLVQGELAVNVTDKRLFTENASGTVVELGTNPSSLALPNGSVNGVAYLNASKVLTTGSALTFDGTTLTASASGAVSGVFNRNTSNGKTLDIQLLAQSVGWLGSNANGDLVISSTSGGLASNLISFALNGSEQAKLTSTGLGIGTSSPNAKLHVAGASGNAQLLVDYSASGDTYSNARTHYWQNSAGASTLMTLNNSGNLGLGVTPSAWNTGKVMQFGTSGAFVFGDDTQQITGVNAYYNAGWKYTGTGYSTKYETSSGTHRWFNAPSGTAGNAISFTQAMTLDASGNLLVGTTSGGITNSNSVTLERSSGAYVIVNHSGTVSGDKFAYFNYNGSGIGSITQNGTTGVLYNLTSDYRLKHNPVPVTGSGEFIDALKPKTWDWHDGSGKGVGFIAHEFMEVAKYSGNGEKDAVDAEGNPIYQSIQPSSSEVMAYLVAELQSLRKRVAELEAK